VEQTHPVALAVQDTQTTTQQLVPVERQQKLSQT
jgi:hypothetical protein